MKSPLSSRGSVLAAVCSTVALTVAACSANPGPPPLVQQEELEQLDRAAEETTTTTPTPPASQRTQIQVGAEPLRAGLNPHLLSDDSALVQSIADVTLPSAFIDGKRNTDLLVGAAELPTSPAEMTVRYVITPEAQWSDGTPITGADFAYLWRGMSSTPGVIDPAAYRAIADVRVSGPGGKIVDVDFTQRVGQWRDLFSHLLPSHLLDANGSDFATAANDSLPASAGRFMLQSVDRGRGTITLNRNDRFWGSDPARVDVLRINAVRDTTQVADQLRAGQIGFLDAVPAETTRDALSLIPDVQQRMVDGSRTLGVTLSQSSPILEDPAARMELRSLIDVPLLARLAAGRSSEISVAEHEPVSQDPPIVLPQRATEDRPVRIAADASDSSASAAARSLADMLEQRGVPARVVSSDAYSIAATGLPSGAVDVVVHWDAKTSEPNAQASRIMCSDEQFRAGNLAGVCSPETEQLGTDILSGQLSPEGGAAAVDEVLRQAALWVPLMRERRILALGSGIVGPETDLAAWEEGLAGAASWRAEDNPAAPEGPERGQQP